MNIDPYMLKFTIWFGCVIFLHEYGHYLLAKKQGIYKGWDIWIGSPRINMTEKYKSRWDYLSGMALSSIIIPLGLLVNIKLIHMILVIVFLAMFDFIAVIFYDKIPKSLSNTHHTQSKENLGGSQSDSAPNSKRMRGGETR